jgi:hypothetical protein
MTEPSSDGDALPTKHGTLKPRIVFTLNLMYKPLIDVNGRFKKYSCFSSASPLVIFGGFTDPDVDMAGGNGFANFTNAWAKTD